MVTNPMHRSCTPVPTSTQNSIGYFDGGRNTSAWTSCSDRAKRTDQHHEQETAGEEGRAVSSRVMQGVDNPELDVHATV